MVNRVVTRSIEKAIPSIINTTVEAKEELERSKNLPKDTTLSVPYLSGAGVDFLEVPRPIKTYEKIKSDVVEDLKTRRAEKKPVVFTVPEWEALMKDVEDPDSPFTYESVVRGVVNQANKNIPDSRNPLIYEELKDGSSPLLGLLPSTKDFEYNFERSLSDAEIIDLLTNVEDYDLSEGRTPLSAKIKAFAGGVKSESPEALGSALGVRAGLPGAYSLSKSLKNPIASALTFLTTMGVSALGGAYVAGKVEDAVLDEVNPVVPELSGYTKAGETAAYGVSLIGGLLKRNPQEAAKAVAAASSKPTIGAIEFLKNFKDIARGIVGNKGAKVSESALNQMIKKSGFTEKQVTAVREAVIVC